MRIPVCRSVSATAQHQNPSLSGLDGPALLGRQVFQLHSWMTPVLVNAPIASLRTR